MNGLIEIQDGECMSSEQFGQMLSKIKRDIPPIFHFQGNLMALEHRKVFSYQVGVDFSGSYVGMAIEPR
jgi:hypothetical protein